MSRVRRLPCKACGGPKASGRGRHLCDPCALIAPQAKRSRLRPTHFAGELRRRYGISIEQYEATLVAQSGVCAICYQRCRTGQRLCVDHDHATGAVRGLLCRRCNNGLGYLEDAAWMAAAASFLATPPGTSGGPILSPLVAVPDDPFTDEPAEPEPFDMSGATPGAVR